MTAGRIAIEMRNECIKNGEPFNQIIFYTNMTYCGRVHNVIIFYKKCIRKMETYV